MDRADLIHGPAIVQFGGATFYTEGDIVAKPILTTVDIQSSMHGVVGKRNDTLIWEITFKPESQVYAGTTRTTALFPWLAASRGDSMFGATDSNVLIHSKAGKTLTFKAGCVVGMPNVSLSATEQQLGDVTIHAIGANDETAWAVAGHFVAIASAAFNDTSYTTSGIYTLPYVLGLTGGPSPWSAIQSQDGWRIEWDVQYSVKKVDTIGIVDYIFEGASAMIVGKPLGVTEEDVNSLFQQAASLKFSRGSERAANAYPLTLSPYLSAAGNIGAASFAFTPCSLMSAGYRFGTGESLRHDEIGFQTIRKFTTGAMDPLAAITAATS